MRFSNKTKPPDELAGRGIRGRATVEHVEMLDGGMDVNVSRRKADAVLKGRSRRFASWRGCASSSRGRRRTP
jgi:hypothetical protein